MAKEINLETDINDRLIISLIAIRAKKLLNLTNGQTLGVEMDVTATHLNGCKLKLTELYNANDFSFKHDIFGIGKHLNRVTGKLDNCFLPRFASKEVMNNG